MHLKSHNLQFPGSVVQLHSPQHSDDVYNGADDDDYILSVSIAEEDDTAVDVDWHTNTSIKMKPVAMLTKSEEASFSTLEVEVRLQLIMVHWDVVT